MYSKQRKPIKDAFLIRVVGSTMCPIQMDARDLLITLTCLYPPPPPPPPPSEFSFSNPLPPPSHCKSRLGVSVRGCGHQNSPPPPWLLEPPLPLLFTLPPIPFLQTPIPMTEDLDVLFLLTDGATIARWNNENLPSDRMSIENATILTNAERWPLMIDPQLQGLKWIKTREGEELKVVRLGQKGSVTYWYLEQQATGTKLKRPCVL